MMRRISMRRTPMPHRSLAVIPFACLFLLTAAKFRRTTGELYERVNKHVNRAPEWMGYFPIPGGFPIVVQGEVVGAIGAGAAGLSGGRDEECAQNAIKSVFGDGKTSPPASPQPLLVTR